MSLQPLHLVDPQESERHAPELERQLLRGAVSALSERRWCCSGCGRSPLVGETLQVFASAGGERALCALCISSAADGSLGEPLRSERVRATDRSVSVRKAA